MRGKWQLEDRVGKEFTMVVASRTRNRQLESRYKSRFDQVRESRPFEIRDLPLGVFDSRRGMGQTIPLQCVRAPLSQLKGGVTY